MVIFAIDVTRISDVRKEEGRPEGPRNIKRWTEVAIDKRPAPWSPLNDREPPPLPMQFAIRRTRTPLLTAQHAASFSRKPVYGSAQI